MLHNRRDVITAECLKNLYFLLIYSRLQYGVLVYGFATATTLKPLFTCCNKVLRTVQFQNRYSNVKQMYLKYNTFSVFQLHKLHIGKLVFKCFNSDSPVPDIIRNLFFQPNAIRSNNYDTRLSNTRYLYYNSEPGFFSSYAYLCYKEWNSIPTDIRMANSFNHFTKLFRQQLFETWYD